jgi:hypothetical protein
MLKAEREAFSDEAHAGSERKLRIEAIPADRRNTTINVVNRR